MLGAVATFFWKHLIDQPRALKAFLHQDGLYLVLDVMETVNLMVQNIYLAVLCDICATDTRGCFFLFTWRQRLDKNKGFLSLLAKVWKDEEKILEQKKNSQCYTENSLGAYL